MTFIEHQRQCPACKAGIPLQRPGRRIPLESGSGYVTVGANLSAEELEKLLPSHLDLVVVLLPKTGQYQIRERCAGGTQIHGTLSPPGHDGAADGP